MTGSLFHIAPPTPQDSVARYSYFPIWAEENADLTAGRFEWAFGNGNDTPNGMGVIFPFACQLIGLGLTLENNSICSVEVRKNSDSTGKMIATNNSRNAWLLFEHDPVDFMPGEVVGFRTIKGSFLSNGGCVVAWFRKEIGG